MSSTQDRALRAALRAGLGDPYRPVSVGDRPVCQVALQRRQQVPKDPLLLQALNDRWPPNVVKRSTDIDESPHICPSFPRWSLYI
jgi:hypothetical protein